MAVKKLLTKVGKGNLLAMVESLARKAREYGHAAGQPEYAVSPSTVKAMGKNVERIHKAVERAVESIYEKQRR